MLVLFPPGNKDLKCEWASEYVGLRLEWASEIKGFRWEWTSEYKDFKIILWISNVCESGVLRKLGHSSVTSCVGSVALV